MCVDVPNNNPKNGHMLQMWNCHHRTYDQHFSVHAPVNCEWGEWGEWAPCSAHCDGGQRQRARAKAFGVTVQKSSTGQSYFYALKKLDRPHGGGKDCVGAPQQKQSCNVHACRKHDDRHVITNPQSIDPVPAPVIPGQKPERSSSWRLAYGLQSVVIATCFA